MNIVICDDDLSISTQLEKYIYNYFSLNHLANPQIYIFSNGHDLLNCPETMDIVFLDIEMPGFSGIYVGQELKKRNCNCIIFIITSFIEYLDDAMRFHVFRYFTKPIDQQRLFRNLNDALMQYFSIIPSIVIETKESVVKVSASDILFIEASGRKVSVYTINGVYLSTKTLSYWLDFLPSNTFIQTHRSYIVNLAHVKSFDHSLIYLDQNNFTVYLTRRKYTQFKSAYMIYLESSG